jgi:putative ABC transport system permease protein
MQRSAACAIVVRMSNELSAAAQPPAWWHLAARQLSRDWRAGELRLLALAVLLAVAALTAVGFFADA